MKRQLPFRRGFTLVELLLSTVIAVMLLGAVLMVVTHLVRDGKRIADQQTAVSPMPRILELLRHDMTVGRTLHVDPKSGETTITGYGSIDANGTLTGQACDVSYRIVKNKDRSGLLVRTQRLHGDRDRKTRTDLIAIDVKDFRIELLAPNAQIDGNSPENNAESKQVITSTAHISITLDQHTAPEQATILIR